MSGNKGIRRLDDIVLMYSALDLHKRYSEVVVMDGDGVVLREERIENSVENLEKFSDSLPPNTKIVIESSSTWYWAYRILSSRHRVILSNPVKTKAIASVKVKTDTIDTIMLADLLRGGYIAECYIPPEHIMELRELVRYRANLVRLRTSIKNRIHAHLLMNNIKMNAGSFTQAFIDRLKEIGSPRIQGYLRILGSINAEINEASRMISARAMDDEDAKLLMTVPGISFYSAVLIVSEIGDINRFPDSYHLVSYAGLVASTHSSGGVTYHGRITKVGSPYLRWALNQCTRVHIRAEPDGNIARFYQRLARKKGDGKAIVAASAKLLKIVYWVLKERRAYVTVKG